MESLTKALQAQRFAENPEIEVHRTGEGVGEGEMHEKKSVLKKVKEKAKKLKNTIGGKKKHGHGHGHDHDHDYEHEAREHGLPRDYLEEEDEDEEEMEEYEPEVHGGQPRVKLEQSGPFDEDPNTRRSGVGLVTPGIYEAAVSEPGDPASRSKEVVSRPLHGHDKGPEESRPSGGDPLAKRADRAPVSPDPVTASGPKDPEEETGSGLTPVLRSVEDLKLEEETHKAQSGGPDAPTGSHDQFAPEEAETETTQSKDERDQTYAGTVQSVVASAIASGTTAIVEKAVSAKDTVAAKIGYGGEAGGEGRGFAEMLTEKLTPVYEKVAGAKEAVVSKMQAPKRDDEGVSATHYLVEKLSPGEEDKALSEVISYAVHTQKAGEESGKLPEGGNTGVLQKVKEVAGSLIGKTPESHDATPEQQGHVEVVEENLDRRFEEQRDLQESTI